MLMVARGSVEFDRFRRIRILTIGSFEGPTDYRGSFEGPRAADDETRDSGRRGTRPQNWVAGIVLYLERAGKSEVPKLPRRAAGTRRQGANRVFQALPLPLKAKKRAALFSMMPKGRASTREWKTERAVPNTAKSVPGKLNPIQRNF
jgi:hypothetical protein